MRSAAQLISSKQRVAGFTLVELMVVIAIIGVLVAMLLPSLHRARRSAQTLYCLSNLRQISQSAMIYTNENRGWLMTNCEVAWTNDNGQIIVPGFPGAAWLDTIFTMTRQNIRILECPEQVTERHPSYETIWPYGPRRVYPGYMINSAVRTQYYNYPSGPQWASGLKFWPTKPLKLSAFKKASQKVWFCDGALHTATAYPFVNAADNVYETYRTASSRNWFFSSLNSYNGRLSGRHGRFPDLRGNIVCFDGHAETVASKDYWAELGTYYYEVDAIYGKYWDPDGDGSAGTPDPDLM